jgi:hypothetical protein
MLVFSLSGSDFVEMFVGVGASRARDLFEQPRNLSRHGGILPCGVLRFRERSLTREPSLIASVRSPSNLTS